MYEYFYAFVEFKGGQYQDGLMATCPVEETNEMLSVQIRVDDNFQISIYFIRLQVASKTFLCLLFLLKRVSFFCSRISILFTYVQVFKKILITDGFVSKI